MAHRVLIFNWHEGYIHLLAKTGYAFDVVEVQKGGRFGWVSEFRPLPSNCRLITEDKAAEGVAAGMYNRVICQNADDLLFVYKSSVPVVQLFHTKFSYMTALLPQHVKKSFRDNFRKVIDSVKDITLVYVSQSKSDEWGFGGDVVLPGIDASEYSGYTGVIPRVLRVGNGLTGNSMRHIEENILYDMPYAVIGDSPAVPGAYLPKDWNEYRKHLRDYRVYLCMIEDKDDDGYNLSMLEAMATGMPVVSITNQTSPVRDGVNGYISHDRAYLTQRLRDLLNDRAHAGELGRRARETVLKYFPAERFVQDWKRIIDGKRAEEGMKTEERGARIVSADTMSGPGLSIYEKNLAALKEKDPVLADLIETQPKGSGLSVVETRTGARSLKVNNIALHSLYDPVKEAREWVTHYEERIQHASSLVVLGFGLGYHIIELCKTFRGDIVVYEPRADVIRTALETFCMTAVLQRIRIVTGEDIDIRDMHAKVLQHHPSVNSNREQFMKVIERLQRKGGIPKGLKILVVGPVYGGSLSIARDCSAALRKNGHNVELIDNSRFSDALFYAKDVTDDRDAYNRIVERLSAFLSETVIARCMKTRPDLVLALAQAPLTSECLQRLRETGISTAFWFVEDFRVMGYWKNCAGLYDYFFTIQRGEFIDELKRCGAKNVHYLPLAANPDIHRKTELNDEEKKYYGSDVSFVGAGYYNRRQFFKGLVDHDFKIWGTDWDMDSSVSRCVQRGGERVETEEIVLIYNAAKISINLHSSTYHKGINPHGDFVNPRTFEIASCGGFQLVDRRQELGGLFREGEEIIVFEGIEDLREKIMYYLSHPEERMRIAERARQRVLREHTFENRMRDMIGLLAGSGFQNISKKEQGERVGDLINEAGDDKEISEFLNKFSGRERITLADIVDEIEHGEGELARTEAMFLIMSEFVK